MSLRCVALLPRWERPLNEFLEALRAAGDERSFHPHRFTAEEVARLARHEGPDYYCVLVEDERVLGYGMLRGWDEGYPVPRLGIAVHPAARRRGCARRLMQHLHDEARRRGAASVELRVLEDNDAAIALYRDLGYRFGRKEERYLVGVLALGK